MPGILVVEDDENLNRGITFSLKKSGYDVFSAESVKKSKKIAWVHSNFQEYHFSANAYDNDEEELNAYSQFNNIVFCSKSVQNAFDKTLKNNFKNKEVIYPLIHSAFCNECAQQHQQQMQEDT